jgi:peptidoglycan/LPS O-acetylase OafA/YrhL
MKYRPEIDGLRSIAVLPVILFHAGFSSFNGGFVGVDIFFVISGYLITTIILTEMELGTFSITKFYERRARRILPALFLIMLVSFAFGWFLLFPADLKDFSQSLVAVPLFSSNILFWFETGYWGVENELKPLLHTWSLAVEEQYYIFFPVFMLVMWRCSKLWILRSFILITCASLFYSHWAQQNFPSANFFLLPSRAWELAIGAGVAFHFIYKGDFIQNILSSKLINELFGLFGLGLVFYSIFFFDEHTPFPSFYALVPTIGTALIIIFSSSSTYLGRLLGSPIPVGIGLISYSAYLWHQPLFAFARHRSLSEPLEYIFILLTFLTLILAYLTWRFVEKPFRSKTRISRNNIFLFGICGSLFFISLGLAGHFTDGFNGIVKGSRVTQEIIERKWKINHGLSETCANEYASSDICRTSEQPEIAIWGDSYAMHLVQGILSSNPTAKVIQVTKSLCGPILDISPIDAKHPKLWGLGCLKFNDDFKEWLKVNNSVKYIVISSPFSQYISAENKILNRDGSIQRTDRWLLKSQLRATLNTLQSLDVTPIVFSPPPADGNNIGRCLARAEWMGMSLDNCNFKTSQFTKERNTIFSILDELSTDYKIIRLDKMICVETTCRTHIEGTWLFRDAGHLSIEGSSLLGYKYDFYKKITEKP